MNILFIGDIVGAPGRRVIKELVPKIVKKESIDLVVANAENAAGGSGITPTIAEELFEYGVDVLTSGDHIWKRREIIEELESNPCVLRPLNYPENTPGRGSCVVKAKSGAKVAVLNLIGRVFMDPLECPF